VNFRTPAWIAGILGTVLFEHATVVLQATAELLEFHDPDQEIPGDAISWHDVAGRS
jgi:hypothetical protein